MTRAASWSLAAAADVHQGGLWEFPGGKLEPGEHPTEAWPGSCAEELGVQVLACRPLIRVHHDYGDRHVLLDVHRVTDFAGAPVVARGSPWPGSPRRPWTPAFPAADRPIIAALRLPQLYLITGPRPSEPADFLSRLGAALARGIRLVQLRAHRLARPPTPPGRRRLRPVRGRRGQAAAQSAPP